MTNKSKEITYFSLFLQVLFGCIYPDMCIAYSFGFAWLHFTGHVYCIHFGFVFFGSLYIKVIQGYIHDRLGCWVDGVNQEINTSWKTKKKKDITCLRR
jgi:hypothetical protein